MGKRSLNDKAIVAALWIAIENGHFTWDSLADGMDITFLFNGKIYVINSRVSDHPRTMDMDRFAELVEDRAIAEVTNG